MTVERMSLDFSEKLDSEDIFRLYPFYSDPAEYMYVQLNHILHAIALSEASWS